MPPMCRKLKKKKKTAEINSCYFIVILFFCQKFTQGNIGKIVYQEKNTQGNIVKI